MQIPKAIQLAGINIEIIKDNKLVKEKKVIGEARYSEQSIVIDTEAAPADITEQAFFHELTHWILYVMNEDELRNNEKHVDLFGHLLYQAIKTAGYRLEK